MKKVLLGTVACILVVAMSGITVWAASVDIDTSGLSNEQKAQLAVKIAEMQKQVSEVPTVEKVNQWVDVGKNVGVALAATAKEIGMASDQFLQSNTGKITVVLIIWKVIGKDLTGLVVGIGMLLTLVPLWVYFFRKMCIVKTVRIEYPADKFKKIKHYEYYNQGSCDETRLMMLLVVVAIIVVSLIVIF